MIKSKIAISVILLLCLFNLVPPLFSETAYFDNVYYLLLYIILTHVSICVPFLVEKLNIWFKRISQLIGGWFFSGVVVEVINFATPLEVFNSIEDKLVYTKYLIGFTIAIMIMIISETWQKQRK